MRYHHRFAVFSANEVLFSDFETKTDKTGVEFALKYFKENPALFADLKTSSEGVDIKKLPQVVIQTESVFGHVIASYSRKEAIEDGVLIAFDDKIVKEAGINYPIALSTAAYQLIDDAVKKGGKDLDGVIWDMLTMFRYYAKKSNYSTQFIFEMLIWEKHVGKDREMKFKAICGPGDTEEPVITIMLPNED